MIAGLIVHRDLDLVCLVDVELVSLIDPAVVSRGLGPALDGVFDFDVDEGLGSSAEAASGRVIDVGHGVHCEGQMTTQRLALARYAQAVICNDG